MDGLDVFIPKVGTIDGTELIDGDIVGDRVVGSGERVPFDEELEDGLKVVGTCTGAFVGAAVSCEDIESIVPFITSNHRAQLSWTLHQGEKNAIRKNCRNDLLLSWYLPVVHI
jgi:hypothetical protein